MNWYPSSGLVMKSPLVNQKGGGALGTPPRPDPKISQCSCIFFCNLEKCVCMAPLLEIWRPSYENAGSASEYSYLDFKSRVGSPTRQMLFYFTRLEFK